MIQKQVLWISIVLILAIVFAILFGCNSSQYEMYTLEHGKAHFSFEYPRRYKKQMEYLQPSDDAPKGIRFVYRQYDLKEKNTVFGFNISPALKSLDAKGAIDRTISGLKDMKHVVERSTLTVDGISSEMVVYYDSRMPYTPSVRELFFVSKELLWNIYIYSDTENAEQAKTDFEHILRTFKIISD